MNRSVVRRPGFFFSIRNHSLLIEKGENKHVILDGKHALEKPTNFMRIEDWNGEMNDIGNPLSGRTFLLSQAKLVRSRFQRSLGFCRFEMDAAGWWNMFSKLVPSLKRRYAHWKFPIFSGKYHQNGRFFHIAMLVYRDLHSPKSSFQSLSGVKGCPQPPKPPPPPPRGAQCGLQHVDGSAGSPWIPSSLGWNHEVEISVL